MEEKDSLQLTLTIAGRPYSLKIKASDEPTIRQVAKEVNEKVNKFQLTHPNREKQDCLAMTLLTYAVDLHKAKSSQPTSASPPKELSDKLTHLESILDQALT